jgi:undecaprenyl diphosphate synthase
MVDISAEAIAAARKALDISDQQMPRSVAIIMDGNGRWAQARHLPRPAGHEVGAQVVRTIVTEAARLGLEALTLYSFSIENWRRPRDEVNALMHLYADTLVRERPTIMDNNIRVRHLGRREGLPDIVLHELDETTRMSAGNTGMFLCLALNYGSRAEITDAVTRIATKIAHGHLKPADVNEHLISSSLDTAGIPDPDLLIRTAGEMRVSNFLLWQISYAELYVTQVLWPDFEETEFQKAIKSFTGRHRRFGGLDNPST